jgi:hypothetical protein
MKLSGHMSQNLVEYLVVFKRTLRTGSLMLIIYFSFQMW